MLWRWERVRVWKSEVKHQHERDQQRTFMEFHRVPTLLGLLFCATGRVETYCLRRDANIDYGRWQWYSVDSGKRMDPKFLDDQLRAHELQEEIAKSLNQPEKER
jgi:hypothetical protein